MSYLPLARKYRPQTLADLIGQPHVTATLSRALEQKHVAQAYVFSGLRGVGKTSAARILARCLNCVKGPTASPCGDCESCKQITLGNSLDVIEIDGASNRGIDEIRSLRETVPYAPIAGKYRIYIIDEVHMLTAEAFNALLKTLEEPPAHVKFIFATTAVNKLPSTILSRCQRFDFRRIEAKTAVEVLERVAKAEKIRIESAALFAIARTADGSLRDAEVSLDQLASFVDGTITEAHVTELLGAVESEALTTLTQTLLDRDTAAALALLMGQFDQGKDAVQILLGLLRHVRNLLILRSTDKAANRSEMLSRLIDEPAERLALLEKQAAQASAEEWLLMLQVLIGAYELLRRSPMGRTILELAVIRLATSERWQSLDEISRRLQQLESSEPASSRQGAPVAALASPKKYPAQAAVSIAATDSGPEPAMSAAAVDGPAAVIAIWPTFIEQLGQQKMSVAAYLMHAKPLQLDGQVLTIGLAGFTLHQEVLSVADNRRLIDQLLSDLCQTKITVQYATLPEAKPESAAKHAAEPAAAVAGGASSTALVQDIVNLFNATVLNQPSRIS